MQIDFGKLQYQYQLYKEEIDKSIHNVMNPYLNDEEIEYISSVIWLQ